MSKRTKLTDKAHRYQKNPFEDSAMKTLKSDHPKKFARHLEVSEVTTMNFRHSSNSELPRDSLARRYQKNLLRR